MGSILAISEIQKNKTAECFEMGMYPFLAVSISFSVIAACFCFTWMSSDRILLVDNTLIPVSSSKMFPSDEDSTYIHNHVLLRVMRKLSKDIKKHINYLQNCYVCLTSKILSSISFNVFLLLALSTIIKFFFSSNSGFS